MVHRWSAATGIALLLLTGCNFSQRETDDEPTVVPVETQVLHETDTETPVPTAAATPTVSAPRATATATNTSTPFPIPTHPLTATPTLTSTPIPTQVIPETPMPTSTSAPPPTFTPPPIFVPTLTFTPVVYVTNTPVSTDTPGAVVCSTCGGLRLRETPGTAGNVSSELDANTPLTVIGRTDDSKWIQVALSDGSGGWVFSGYLVINIDLAAIAVTGVAQDASVAATGPIGTSDVISGVSSNSRAIFLDGLAKGNIPYAFTRVGDSISASPNFLTPIGHGGYSLGNYSYLGGAISFFSGPNGRGANPFAAASIAARNGWSTESVLNPANADLNVCHAGETPLECEYRLVKPAVALIMFGTNDSGGMSSGTFQANLQTIVQKSINMGVIPVLSTIPPKHYNPATDGRIFEFNEIIAATARGYDVPLWDYYSAMARLPREGLASDGVHPSGSPDGQNAVFDDQHLQYGYPMRNLTALQVLYLVWQQVLYGAGQAVPATAPSVAQPVSNGDCSHAPPARLTVGAQARVTPGLPNKVRSAPSISAGQIGSIPGEAVFAVIGGPQCADGYRWWQVDYQGLVGWTASGYDGEYWVAP